VPSVIQKRAGLRWNHVNIDGDHIYRTPDRVIRPGFSEIVAAMGVCRENPFWTEGGRQRGTATHQWAAFAAEGKHTNQEPDERIRERVYRFRKWLDFSGFKTQGAEIPLYDPLNNFCCTEDLFGVMHGATWVVELKNGGPLKIHALQTGAQKIALAANGFGAIKRGGLYLKDKKVRLIEHPDRGDMHRWRKIVAGYHAMSRAEREIFAAPDFEPSISARYRQAVIVEAYNARRHYEQ